MVNISPIPTMYCCVQSKPFPKSGQRDPRAVSSAFMSAYPAVSRGKLSFPIRLTFLFIFIFEFIYLFFGSQCGERTAAVRSTNPVFSNAPGSFAPRRLKWAS